MPTVLGVTALATAGTGVPAVARAASASPLNPSVISAAAPSVPRPPVPAGLPGGIEAPSPYLQQVSCDPRDKPGAVALGKLLKATYAGTSYSISRACGVDGAASEHYEGRAVDWFVSVRDPGGAQKAASLLDWLLGTDAAGHGFANARRLGVMYVIWNDRIWGSYANAAGWRSYSLCANHPEPGWDTRCHRDHMHLSLSWAGATGVTSYWTGKVSAVDYGPCRPADLNWAAPRTVTNSKPCPGHVEVIAPPGAPSPVPALFRYSGAIVGRGQTGPAVRAVQSGLRIGADGVFGPGTASAVASFRRSQKLPSGSTVDAPTWRALLEFAVASLTPRAEPGTAGGVGTAGGAGTTPSAASPLTRYKGLVLTPGSTSPAVTAVQKVLGVTPASGYFGPLTKAAVVAFQRAHRVPATGNVGPLTWRALGA